MTNQCCKRSFTSLTSLLLLGCSADLSDYQQPEQHPFDVKTYFTGDIAAWGLVQDRSDKVTRRFCVQIKANWQANIGTLAETFYFQDGEISYRNWQLTKQTDGTYTGTAEDVVGTAIGAHQGFAFQLNYQLLLPVEDSIYQVSMDDWMYQLDKYRVMNKTSISKFGIKLATVTLFFDKQQQYQPCASLIERSL